MGIKCKIVYNKDNSINFVEAPNGSRSRLFDDLKSMDLSDSEALDIWTVSTTEIFKEDFLNPLVNSYRMRIMEKLKSLSPKKREINLVIDGKEKTVNLNNMEYSLVETPNFITIESTIGDTKIGTIRINPFRDGYQVTNSFLNEIQFYDKGSLGSIRNKGIGTEMYKELINTLITEGIPVYSSIKSSPEAEGIWNKFRNLGIVETEIVEGGRYFKVNPNPNSVDQNGEPFVRDVLSYLESINNDTDNMLSESEILDIQEAMLNTDLNSSEDLFNEMTDIFFDNGTFEVTRNGLRKGNLYTPSEQENILRDVMLQNSIKNLYFKMKNSPVINNDIFVDTNFITIDTTQTNIIGKNKITNPFITEKEAIEILSGTNSREEFEEKLLNSNLDYLKERYFNTIYSDDDIYYKISNYNLVEDLRIEDGQLVNNLKNPVVELMEETLTDPSDTELIESINYMYQISPTIWINNPEEIKVLLRDFSEKTIDIGLDTVGLQDFYDIRGINEFNQLFDAIDRFVNSQNETNFNNLTSIYKNFFGISDDINLRPVNTSVKNSIYLDTDISSYELFNNFGLLPIGEKVYRRVNNSRNLDEVYNMIYQNVLQNPNILPLDAYSGFAIDKEGILDRSKLNKPENQEIVIQKIKEFVRREINIIDVPNGLKDIEMLEKMYLYSSFFNTHLNNVGNFPYSLNESDLMANPISNQGYLTSDFISDFNKDYLRSKLNNRGYFDSFYSNFKITKKGIKLVNRDVITMKRLEIELKNKPDLRNHLLLQKDSDIENQTINNNIIEGDLLWRNYYINYPMSLKKYLGDYTKVDDNTILANSYDNFIRVDKGVFEMSDSYGNLSVFKRLQENTSDYKIYSPSFNKPINGTDFSNYSIIEVERGESITVNNKYTLKEEEDIDNLIDNCS